MCVEQLNCCGQEGYSILLLLLLPPLLQVRAHHYCSHVNEEMRQCLIYGNGERNARLIGRAQQRSQLSQLSRGLHCSNTVLQSNHNGRIAGSRFGPALVFDYFDVQTSASHTAQECTTPCWQPVVSDLATGVTL